MKYLKETFKDRRRFRKWTGKYIAKRAVTVEECSRNSISSYIVVMDGSGVVCKGLGFSHHPWTNIDQGVVA